MKQCKSAEVDIIHGVIVENQNDKWRMKNLSPLFWKRIGIQKGPTVPGEYLMKLKPMAAIAEDTVQGRL